MALTPTQNTALKAAIIADSALNAEPNNDDGYFAIAAALNLEASPAFWVWRTSLTKQEITQATSRTGTVFTWNGNGFITRAIGEQAAWKELFDDAMPCNPSLPNVRQAFLDIFSGTGNAALNRVHLDVIGRRKAKRAEKLFATGSGLDTNAGAGTMTFEGEITRQEVDAARNSP